MNGKETLMSGKCFSLKKKTWIKNVLGLSTTFFNKHLFGLLRCTVRMCMRMPPLAGTHSHTYTASSTAAFRRFTFFEHGSIKFPYNYTTLLFMMIRVEA